MLFKVKAELSGFKKSMDELKKMAKETSKNVKKSMNMDLSKEGSNAGKTFAKGFNEEMKSATDSVKLELKKLAEQASNIKIKVDSNRPEYKTGILKDGITLSDVWTDIPALPHNAKEKVDHPTQKPIKLMERIISLFTNEGDTILDFCMGSGSTGVACKNLNRNFIGIEKDLNYFNISKERLNYEN